MGTPSIDTVSHEAVITTNNTPTMIALIAPETGWYGRVAAEIHAYRTSDKSACASFVVRGIAGRIDGTAAVYLTDVYDFESTAGLVTVTASLQTGTYASQSHVLLMATGHLTFELEWHVRTTTMFEAA
jgi:hypothetical protein